MSFTISAAARAQLSEIRDIYNEVIRNSTAVFSDVEVTLADREAWFDAKCAAGFPVLVATDPSGVVGFGTLGEFRTWPGYRYSVEHTVHVRADRRGRGIGRALVQALLQEAARMQKHVMIAGIDAQNVTSIALHEKLGFRVAGELKEVAFKFGRWLDLKFMQRLI
ncbi:MAG: N-acetyltransferase family protein [Steroidobacteraceae bacterium]